MNFLGLGASAKVAIRFTDIGDAPTKNFLNEKGAKEELVIYQGADDVVGEVDVTPSKKLDHYGIKIELLGKIEYSSGSSYEFTSPRSGARDGPAS